LILKVYECSFKAAPSMALSESVGTIRRRTAYSQNLREYECSNWTSGIRGTFYDISCERRAILGADEKNLQYFFAVVGVYELISCISV